MPIVQTLSNTKELDVLLIIPRMTTVTTSIANAGSSVATKLSCGFCGISGGSRTVISSVLGLVFIRVVRLNFG